MPVAFYVFIAAFAVLLLQGILYSYEASHGRVRFLSSFRRRISSILYRMLEMSYDAVVTLQEKAREKTPVHRKDIWAFLQRIHNAILAGIRASLARVLKFLSYLHRITLSIEKRQSGDRQSSE